jgi:GNAT superfamily N-acetyltransferase
MPYDILSMAVLPDTQGTGVGKLLMNAAEGTARERGFSAMTLCVNIDNERGIRFYESCGWHKTQSMEGMWCMEKHFVPEAGPQGVHPASPHAATVRE